MVKRILFWPVMLIVVGAALYWNYDYSLWKKARIYNNRAADHIDAGKYDEGIGEAEEAIKLYPRYAKAYANLGSAYIQKGVYDRANKTPTRGFIALTRPGKVASAMKAHF